MVFFFHGHTGLTDLGKRMRGGHLVFSLLHTKLCMLPALLSPLDNDPDCLAEVYLSRLPTKSSTLAPSSFILLLEGSHHKEPILQEYTI